VQAQTTEGSGAVLDQADTLLDDGDILLDHEDTVIDDEELTRLALSADADAPLAPDAVPISSYLAELPALLPEWYMPGITAGRSGRWRGMVILGIVGALLFIEALGLCSTFGSLSFG
jgi:hypothetical protein